MIHIGFTGTRHGMSTAQYFTVNSLVAQLADLCGTFGHRLTAHHGDCDGADAQFHQIAEVFGAHIVIHPPIDGTHRAHCKGNEWRAELSHFARNRAIVTEATVMIATPKEQTRQERGGTWYTVDRTGRSGKPLALVLPTQFNGAQILYSGEPWPCEIIQGSVVRA